MSKKGFEQNYSKYADSKNVFMRPKDTTRHDTLDGERKERFKRWITFFRRNPFKFCEFYFGIRLHPYQVLWLWVLQRSNLAYIVAARSTAKSFIIAIWALCLAVLYPGIEIITSSKTMKQGGVIIAKLEQLRDKYSNVEREIRNITRNANTAECIFHCGSVIRAVPSSENARGNRANYLIVEESRLVNKEILDQVLKPFLYSRTPNYRLLPEYMEDSRLKEEGIISYITSAGFKSENWFQNVKSCIKRMVRGDAAANFLAFDYLITLYHNIKTEEMIKNEFSDNDPLTVQMEYYNIPAGSSGKCFYRSSYFQRVIKRAFYPLRIEDFGNKKTSHDVKRVDGEIRFISVDVAARAGKNDLTIISCIKLLPLLGRGYDRELLYMESFKGINTVKQARRIKEVFEDFDADYLILDIANVGIGIYDALTQTTQHDERGVILDAMTVVGEEFDFIESKVRDDLRERTLSLGAKPVIFPITGTPTLNSLMASLFRSALQKKLWQFLIPENIAEEWLAKNIKEFTNNVNDVDVANFYMQPYVQTSLMIGECINLDMSLLNGIIKLQEKSGAYKDRYIAILYCNYIVSFFDKNLLKEEKEINSWDIIKEITLFG